MLKSLTKENFWDEMFQKYEPLVNEFCRFVDEYKARISWPDLLGTEIKYHEIPIELQVGIFIQWTMERGSVNNFLSGTYCNDMDQFTTAMKDWFKEEYEDTLDYANNDPEDVLEGSGFISAENGIISVREGSAMDRMLSAHPRNAKPVAIKISHTLYKTGDKDIPEAILDRNNEVVLDMCKICGRAESELAESCNPPKGKDEEME